MTGAAGMPDVRFCQLFGGLGQGDEGEKDDQADQQKGEVFGRALKQLFHGYHLDQNAKHLKACLQV